MANRSVKSVHKLVNKIAGPYVKAFHGYHAPVPKNYLRSGRKGTTLRNLVAGRIKLERKHGMIARRDHYQGNKYVHGRQQKRY